MVGQQSPSVQSGLVTPELDQMPQPMTLPGKTQRETPRPGEHLFAVLWAEYPTQAPAELPEPLLAPHLEE